MMSMSNIVKGIVVNNKYLTLYNEYMINNMYRLTNSNNRVRANVCCGSGSNSGGSKCDDCDGSCVSSGSKYRQLNIFNNALTIPSPNALTFPSPNALTIPSRSASLLCSKLCSDNIHNDCICL